ncbi:hypothetical protein K8I61_04185 [bacterium]|nr:hypothetical protein [bacterium]
MLNRILGALSLALLLGAAAIVFTGATPKAIEPPQKPNIDVVACEQYMQSIYDFDSANGLMACILLTQSQYWDLCVVNGPWSPQDCAPIVWDVAFAACLAIGGLTRPPEFVASWEYTDAHCESVAALTAEEYWNSVLVTCFGLAGTYMPGGDQIFCALDGFFETFVGYACPYHTCTGDWPDLSGDDDTSDDDASDDDTDVGEFAASLEITFPSTILTPMTTYDFDFTVANTSTTHASHWINQVEIFMPTEDYAIDPANVASPDSLHGGGMWQAAIAKANEPHIRWDFLDGPTLSDVGDIREGESLDFSFRARTDPQGTDGFDYRIAADSGQFVADTAFVTHAGDPASAESDGVSDEAAATGAGPGDDDAFDDDAFDVDSDADDDDDDDDAKADDDDDDDDNDSGGGVFSC